MKRLLVDYSLIGHGREFELTLLHRERTGLEVGSRVEVVGDGVPPRIAVSRLSLPTRRSSNSPSRTDA